MAQVDSRDDLQDYHSAVPNAVRDVPAARGARLRHSAAYPCSCLPSVCSLPVVPQAGPTSALGHERSGCDAGSHPALHPASARQHPSADREGEHSEPCPNHHCVAVNHHAPDRDRPLCAPRFRQLCGRADRDCQSLHAAYASRHASCRVHHDHRDVVDLDLDRDRHDDNDVNADRAGSNPMGTSRRHCQTRCRTRTPPAPDATNCDCDRTGCAGTTPSNRCNKPSVRSDKAPSPKARSQPKSNHTADTTPIARFDTAPNRCRR